MKISRKKRGKNINWDSDSVDFNYTKPCSVSKRSCLLILIEKSHREKFKMCNIHIFQRRLLGWLQEWSTEKKVRKKIETQKKETKMSHMRMDKVNSTFASPSLLVLCFMCSFFDDLNRYFFCDLSGILFQCQLFKLPCLLFWNWIVWKIFISVVILKTALVLELSGQKSRDKNLINVFFPNI